MPVLLRTQSNHPLKSCKHPMEANTSDDVIIKNNGDVGIGTVNPVRKIRSPVGNTRSPLHQAKIVHQTASSDESWIWDDLK